jgi:DNA-binding transcriptional LysR family regulator
MDAGLNLFRLRVFAAVVEKGGYTAAAAHLDISQPSVTFHVKALERALGARLLIYRERGVHLTPEGDELYRTARVMLRDAENLTERIRHLREGRHGRLLLGASIAFEQPFFFQQVIAPFYQEHPGISLTLRFGHSVRLAEAVLDRELDLAYVNDWHFPAGVRYEPLHRSEFVFMVSPEHPLAQASEVTPRDIDEAGIIAAPVGGIEAVAYSEVLRAAGLRQYHIAVEIDGMQARVLAARAGLGVFGTYIPPYARHGDLGPLVPLQVTGSAASSEFGLVSRDDQPWTPLMELFARHLRGLVTGSLQ